MGRQQKSIALKTFPRCVSQSLIKTGKRYLSSPACSATQIAVKKLRTVPEVELRFYGLQLLPVTTKGICGLCKTGQNKVEFG